MGLPIHGSQNMNMNHIRLIYNKFNYVKSRYEYLISLSRRLSIGAVASHKNFNFYRKKQKAKYKQHSYRIGSNAHKASLSLPLKSSHHCPHYSLIHKQKLKQAFPILSNMPLIHLNSSLILVNTSPFALNDRRFGILHHHSPSMSYY